MLVLMAANVKHKRKTNINLGQDNIKCAIP